MRNARFADLVIVVGALAAAALWIDFSAIHRYQNSDSLLMVFISVYRWTPLVWEQDRLGTLFPLLALPWRDPWANMLVQVGMNIFVCLAGFFLVGYYSAGRTLGIAAGAVGAMLLLAFLTPYQQFSYLVIVQHFGTSSAIGVAGLILLGRWSASQRRGTLASAAICLVVAHWINPGVAFALIPLLLVRRVAFVRLDEGFVDRPTCGAAIAKPSPAATAHTLPRRRATATGWLRAVGPRRVEWTGLLLIAAAMAISVILSRTGSDRKAYRFLWPADWLSTAIYLWQNRNDDFDARWFHAVDLTALVGLATLCLPAGRQAARTSLPLAAGLLLAAATQFAFMSSIDHVRAGYCTRYTMMAMFFWQAALVGFAVVQLAAVLRWPPLEIWLPRALAAAVVLVAAVTHGRPGPSVVRAEIDATMSRYTDDILAAGCTHVTGDYWRAWPAMFHVNLRLAETGSPRRVWAICHRARATQKYWRSISLSEMRVAAIIGDEERSALFLAYYHAPPLAPCEQVGTIRVLRPVDEAGASMAASAATSDTR